ncbi:MAG: DUF4236 domain-containing protein [Bacillota bacterium]|nr:DUF4236 domain-containing protein [Bacillota bacterium]
MAWRFRRSIQIAKGVRLNVGKRGVSLSAGVPGFRVGVGPRGAYASAGLPGTGLYYVAHSGRKGGRRADRGPDGSPGKASAPGAPEPLFGRGVAVPPLSRASWVCLVAGFLLFFAYPVAGLLLVAAGAAGQILVRRDPLMRARLELDKARASFRKGRYEEAVAHATACLAARPEASQARYLLGVSLLRSGRGAGAAEPLLQVEGEEPFLLLQQAAALQAAGRCEEALERMRRLPADLFHTLPVRNAYAGLLLEAGRPEVALEVLRAGPTRRKIAGDPELLELHYLLGRAYEALGRRARARQEYARIVADTPGYRDAEARLRELESGSRSSAAGAAGDDGNPEDGDDQVDPDGSG